MRPAERLAPAHVRIDALPPATHLPQRQPRIAPALWPTIAERARHESLRALALAYGVSHETIRAITRRMGLVATAA